MHEFINEIINYTVHQKKQPEIHSLRDNIHNYFEIKVNENLYIYGKKKATKNRKMGHINTVKFS
ncbi:hypothetical protein [Ehrlichia chaffeensis]|uniref:hypothetical protein n=1 Tax=Ehrlichia chaffeensis TaxID=945 RepID=UPI0039776050